MVYVGGDSQNPDPDIAREALLPGKYELWFERQDLPVVIGKRSTRIALKSSSVPLKVSASPIFESCPPATPIIVPK